MAIRWRRPPWWVSALLGAAAVVGGVAALGGFDETPLAELPSIELGDRHTGNEVETTITAVYLSDERPLLGYDAEEGKQYLVLELTARNVTDEPSLFARQLLRVIVEGAVDGNTAPEGLVAERSASQVTFLQPDVPTEMVYTWLIDEGDAAQSDDIVIGIFERYRALDDPIFDDAYTAPVPVVRIDTTIGARR